MVKNWRDHEVSSKLNELENTSGLYIVFEEDDSASPKGYDLTKGVFDNLDIAKEYAESIKKDQKLYIAVYDDYISGNYNYIAEY